MCVCVCEGVCVCLRVGMLLGMVCLRVGMLLGMVRSLSLATEND